MLQIPIDPTSLLDSLLRGSKWIKSRYDRYRYRKRYGQIEAYYDWMTEIERAGIVNQGIFEYYEHESDRYYRPTLDPNREYPILTLESWLEPTNNINDVLGGFRGKKETSVDTEFVDRLNQDRRFQIWDQEQPFDEIGDPIWNGDCYRLVHCPTTETTFDFELTDYYSYLSDCEQITFEFYNTLAAEGVDSQSSEEAVSEAINQVLPHRDDRAHNFDQLVNCERHYYKVGLNVFTVMQGPNGDYYGLLFLRSANVAEFPRRYHVTPAGTFQPHQGLGAEEFDLKALALREFGEELFNEKELESPPPNAIFSKWIRRFDFIDDLYECLESGTAELYYTGMGFDLLTAKPEMTALLFIDDQKYVKNWAPKMDLNWEFGKGLDSRSAFKLHPDRENMAIPLSDERIRNRVAPNNVIPGGAMAYYQGIKLLLDIDGISVAVSG